MTYEAVSRLANTIHREHVWCHVVAASGHSFIVGISLPEQPELYVSNSQQWREMRLRTARSPTRTWPV
jgi:hypothetical protein